ARAVRRNGDCRRESGVQDPELLAFLTLLHALCELRFLISLHQRLVELFGRVIVPRDVLKLLLSARRALMAGLVACDRAAETLLFRLQDLDLSFGRAQ